MHENTKCVARTLGKNFRIGDPYASFQRFDGVLMAIVRFFDRRSNSNLVVIKHRILLFSTETGAVISLAEVEKEVICWTGSLVFFFLCR